ncbi:MAG: type IV pilus biogenesis/stability protein PilW [Xanthomonadales bacterium]|nr:type IV pilus biogenesis/stability protein PilW [Xanthomonadales bacterium]
MNKTLRMAGGKHWRSLPILPLLALACMALLNACVSAQTGPDERGESRKSAEFNTSLGLEYMNRGQFEVALGKLKKALSADPDYAPAQTVTAILYERIGEDALAGKHYQKAYEADPDDGDVNNNYGTYLCKTGNKAKAIGHFMKALDDPFYSTPAVALTNAGSCALGEGELAEADGYLRRALKIQADFPDALINMADLNFEKQSYLTARAFIQRYEAVANHTPSSLMLAFRVEAALGDEQSAVEYRRTLEARFPDSEEADEARRSRSQ